MSVIFTISSILKNQADEARHKEELANGNYFVKQWHAIEKGIEYNPAWANGTGYFDHAVKGEHAVKLDAGAVARCETDEAKPRKLIFVGTRLGTVVAFQRHNNNDGVITVNLADRVRALQIPGLSSALSVDMIEFVIGHDGRDNIGHWLMRAEEEFVIMPDSVVVTL